MIAIKESFTAIICGTLTLGIEIIAGRILSPYFGSSLHQWGALIGVALLSYIGGYVFFRPLTRYGLSPLFAISGIYVLYLPSWILRFLDSLLSLPMAPATILASTVLIGLPSVVWASVLPLLQQKSSTSKTEARILAFSTSGNLIGAWGVAFFLVPFFGAKFTLLCLGCLSLSLCLLWAPTKRIVLLLAVAFAWLIISHRQASDQSKHPALSSSRSSVALPQQKHLVAAVESPYQSIHVWDEQEWFGINRGLAFNGILQFLWNQDDALISGKQFEYYNYATASAQWAASREAKDVLIIGLGGGLTHYQLQHFFPSLRIKSFEIDPAVVALARKYLPLAKTNNIQVEVGDGRALLRRTKETFDCIQLDTFLFSYVPFHLTTQEFFKLVYTHLKPGGILVANFHGVYAESGLLAKLQSTIESVFPSVWILELDAGTTLLVASTDSSSIRERMLFAADNSLPELRYLHLRAANHVRRTETIGEILTDDLNDTEQRLYATRGSVIRPASF